MVAAEQTSRGNKLTKITVDMNDEIKLRHFISPYTILPRKAFFAAIMFNCRKNLGTLHSLNFQEYFLFSPHPFPLLKMKKKEKTKH